MLFLFLYVHACFLILPFCCPRQSHVDNETSSDEPGARSILSNLGEDLTDAAAQATHMFSELLGECLRALQSERDLYRMALSGISVFYFNAEKVWALGHSLLSQSQWRGLWECVQFGFRWKKIVSFSALKGLFGGHDASAARGKSVLQRPMPQKPNPHHLKFPKPLLILTCDAAFCSSNREATINFPHSLGILTLITAVWVVFTLL